MEINRSILDILLQYLPLLIPVVLIQLALLVTALVDLIRREKTHGPKWVWVLVIVPSSAVDTMNLGGLSGMVSLAQQNTTKKE